MTPQEINIAAAEARGWTRIQIGFNGLASGKQLLGATASLKGTPPADKDKLEDDQAFVDIPNIYSDANDQRDAFLEMTEEQQKVFIRYLFKVSSAMIHSSPLLYNLAVIKSFFTHFGECYLKALGK